MKYLVAVVVPVDQWKIAGSYIESSSSTMGAHVDVVWGMSVLQIAEAGGATSN
jgi:hypothetical protein